MSASKSFISCLDTEDEDEDSKDEDSKSDPNESIPDHNADDGSFSWLFKLVHLDIDSFIDTREKHNQEIYQLGFLGSCDALGSQRKITVY